MSTLLSVWDPDVFDFCGFAQEDLTDWYKPCPVRAISLAGFIPEYIFSTENILLPEFRQKVTVLWQNTRCFRHFSKSL